jgi:predicted amidohydrolase YtcJ
MSVETHRSMTRFADLRSRPDRSGESSKSESLQSTNAELTAIFMRFVDGNSSLRWMIAHVEHASVRTLERMKGLGIAWTVQHRLYFKGDEYLTKDPSAARRAPPIRTALNMGLLVAAGTDAPRVAPFNPFLCLRWLLDGKSISGAQIRSPERRPTENKHCGCTQSMEHG